MSNNTNLVNTTVPFGAKVAGKEVVYGDMTNDDGTEGCLAEWNEVRIIYVGRMVHDEVEYVRDEAGLTIRVPLTLANPVKVEIPVRLGASFPNKLPDPVLTRNRGDKSLSWLVGMEIEEGWDKVIDENTFLVEPTKNQIV